MTLESFSNFFRNPFSSSSSDNQFSQESLVEVDTTNDTSSKIQRASMFLREALLKGELELVQEIAENAPILMKEDSPCVVLAAMRQDYRGLDILLQNGFNPSSCKNQVFDLAINKPDIVLFKTLLKYKVVVDGEVLKSLVSKATKDMAYWDIVTSVLSKKEYPYDKLRPSIEIAVGFESPDLFNFLVRKCKDFSKNCPQLFVGRAMFGLKTAVERLLPYIEKLDHENQDNVVSEQIDNEYEIDWIDQPVLKSTVLIRTAMRQAVERNRLGVAQFFIDYGADFDSISDDLYTCAINTRQLDMVECLYRNKIVPNMDKDKVVSRAFDSHNDEISTFIYNNFPPSLETTKNLLLDSIKEMNPAKIRLLSESLKDTSFVDQESIMALFKQGYIESALVLISKGAVFPNHEEFQEKEVSKKDNSNEGLLGGHQRVRRLNIRVPLNQSKRSFIDIAARIARAQVEDRPFEYLAKVCATDGAKLKSDAFPKQMDWHQKPFVKVALYAAYMSSVLWPKDPLPAREQFVILINNDIKRVENTKGLSWTKYSKMLVESVLDIDDFSDVIEEVKESIAFGLCVAPYYDTEEMQNVIAYKHSQIPQHINDSADTLARFMLASDKSTLDYITLNKKWHVGRNRMPTDLRPLKLVGLWPSLFEAQSFEDGYKIVALNTPEDLMKEGNDMNHCVGTGHYATACQEGRSHILSIRRHGISVATIELDRVKNNSEFIAPNGTRWKCIQLRGDYSQAVSKEILGVYQQLVKRINKGSVRLFPELKKKDLNDYSDLNLVTRMSGYAINELDKYVPKIIEHYNSRIFLKRSNGTEVSLLGKKALDIFHSRLADIQKRWFL